MQRLNSGNANRNRVGLRVLIISAIAAGVVSLAPAALADEATTGPLCGTQLTVTFDTNPASASFSFVAPHPSNCPPING